MQASIASLAMVATVCLTHHVCRVFLAIAAHRALPVHWATLSIVEFAPNALLLHACDAITALQLSALSATTLLILIQAPISALPALVLAAVAKLPQSAQTVSMATSCRHSTTLPLVAVLHAIPTVQHAETLQHSASAASMDHHSLE